MSEELINKPLIASTLLEAKIYHITLIMNFLKY